MLKVYDRVLDRRMQDIEQEGNPQHLNFYYCDKVLAIMEDAWHRNACDATPDEIVQAMAILAAWYEQLEAEGRV